MLILALAFFLGDSWVATSGINPCVSTVCCCYGRQKTVEQEKPHELGESSSFVELLNLAYKAKKSEKRRMKKERRNCNVEQLDLDEKSAVRCNTMQPFYSPDAADFSICYDADCIGKNKKTLNNK